MLYHRGWLPFLALTLALALSGAALAEDQGVVGDAPAETPMPALGEPAGDLTQASAANAALLYRSGGESDAFAYWETALGHVPKTRMQKKVTVAMLRNAVGLTEDATPIGRTGIQFKQCYEVPLPTEGEQLQKEVDFNLHGSVYTDSPLTSVTAAFVSRAGGKGEEQTVTFPASSEIMSYSLVSSDEPNEGKSLDSLVDVSGLNLGRYQFTLSAATVAQPTPVNLYSVEVKVEKVFPYMLTQNKFDDNYSEAYAFFGGDTSQFLFTYSFRDKEGREVSTQTTWREAALEETNVFGRAHRMAVPYFNKAYDYMNSTYFKVDTLRSNGEVREGNVTLLYDIMDKGASGYSPRFQSNKEYLSHHTLGTAIDVNEDLYPNQNVITNHELIGNDVRDNLEYRGIKTDEEGREYYDFYYSGSYKAYYKRLPKTIVNYLLYELAFYRAGFQWGFYYETACDAMHFMLTENDRNKHMDSEVGLRKVYTYIGETAPFTGSPEDQDDS